MPGWVAEAAPDESLTPAVISVNATAKRLPQDGG